MSNPILITGLFFTLTVSAGALTSTQSSPPTSPQIGYKPAPHADQEKTLLLKDSHPASMLHAPTHKIDRAKFYVIDVHNHVNDAQGVDDPVSPQCGRLGILVSIHVTDPEAFFRPLDNTNERYEELIEHPDWSFYGSKFPSKLSILEARDRVIARHSGTTFVALHLANWPENLDYVAGELDRYPNMMVEFGARQAELGRQPRRAREFFLQYQPHHVRD